MKTSRGGFRPSRRSEPAEPASEGAKGETFGRRATVEVMT